MGVPARLGYAVDLLDPDPAERLLEFGCGPGVAAALVCARLTSGRLDAVDRSATAVARTTARNAAHIASGRLAVHTADLHDLPAAITPGSVDAAFGVDVNLFWTGPADPELAALLAALRPGGRLLVVYGTRPGGPTARRVTPGVAATLRAHGFTDVTEHAGPDGSAVAGRRP